MAWWSLVVLLVGATAVLAFPQPSKELQESKAPSWWPDSLPWPPKRPEDIPKPTQLPDEIPWPPANWFPENAPSWWPNGWPWPPQRPSHPEWISWPPQHPEWIPWPPANWFPEHAPSWWPNGWPWPHKNLLFLKSLGPNSTPNGFPGPLSIQNGSHGPHSIPNGSRGPQKTGSQRMRHHGGLRVSRGPHKNPLSQRGYLGPHSIQIGFLGLHSIPSGPLGLQKTGFQRMPHHGGLMANRGHHKNLLSLRSLGPHSTPNGFPGLLSTPNGSPGPLSIPNGSRGTHKTGSQRMRRHGGLTAGLGLHKNPLFPSGSLGPLNTPNGSLGPRLILAGFLLKLTSCRMCPLEITSSTCSQALPQPEERFEWPDRPDWWPGSLPWPPALPEQWPNEPSWWPDSLPWPPAKPEGWPDQPTWWPDSLPWPPAIPDEWPEQPSWWPDSLPWPPAKPEGWPERPSWWPDSLPWPPALPDQWPDQPTWWPDSLPWPPAKPEEIPWPPPGVDPDRIPYIPSRDNQFHLFTRQNPQLSQPLQINNEYLLTYSHYSAHRRSVLLVHDMGGSATASFNAVLVPAFLAAADVNVIVVDWSKGTHSNTYLTAFYSVLSSNFVSRFSRWLTNTTYGDLSDFHIVGLGLGALNAGLIARRLNSEVGYVTALDPSQGPRITGLLPPLNPNVAQYSEVIHTDIGNRGYTQPLGDVDFYPNGGYYMPGCGGDSECNRNRAVYYFAESLTAPFTGVQCANHQDAINSQCDLPGRLQMGGLTPKTGSRGVFWVPTNFEPPFSRG